MDTITHALTGALIGSGFREKTGRAGFACALAASVVPDLDMPLRFFGAAAYLEYHRVVLNSLFVAPFVALAVSLAAWRFGAYKKFFPLFAIALVTVLLHSFMDLTNSYGAKPLWPLGDRWYALDIVFIVDPWITGTLIAGLAAMRLGGGRTAALALCMALLAGYWSGRAYLHERAVESFHRQYPEAVKMGAFPAPVNPFKWRMVARTRDAFWAGWYDLLDGEWEDLRLYPQEPENRYTREAKKDPVAKVFLRFARFPWISAERTDGGWVIRMQDLRFSFSGGRGGFVTTVPVLPDGSLGPGEFSFR